MTTAILAGAITFGLAVYVLRRNNGPRALAAALLLFSGAEWSLAYALERLGPSVAAKVFWDSLGYIGPAVVPLAWLAYVLEFIGQERWVTRRNFVRLSVLPAIALLLIFTNGAHGLVWTRIVLPADTPFAALEKSPGWGFWLILLYPLGIILLTVVQLVRMRMRSAALYRQQADALLVVIGLPWLAAVLYNWLGWRPFGPLNPALPALTIASLILLWSKSRLRLGDIMPVAQEAIVEGLSDGIIVLDKRDRIVHVNPVCQVLSGRPAVEVIGRPVEDVWPEWAGQLTRTLDGPAMGQEVLSHKGQEQRTYDLRSSPLQDKRGHSLGRAIVLRDITERKRAEEQLAYDALHDGLTGLPNRALFMDRLNKAFARLKRNADYRFAVLFLDLDRFKVINDSLGHLVGDQLLVEVGRRLQTCLREVDTVARFGGDEFVILLEEVYDVSLATHVATRIQAALSAGFALGGHEVFTSTSIGIVLSYPYYGHAEELVRDADIAMYRAKDQGRSCYALFDREMHARAMTAHQVETDLRYAIEREEFELFYQPIMAMEARKLIGFEALVRWRHPSRGLLPPAAFIPVAEDSDLIVPIGHWVLREMCSQLAIWQRQFPQKPPLMVSVNLSGRQLRDPSLFELVKQQLDETSIDPSSVVLEITEHVIVADVEMALLTLSRLKSLGVQLHMDDFGTGYSSLSVLHDFPIDSMKIDRSFIQRLSSDLGSLEIVRTIVKLGQSLNIGVIAEGIESAQELAQLQALECVYGQGFYFHEPLDRRAATALMEQSRNGRPTTAAQQRLVRAQR